MAARPKEWSTRFWRHWIKPLLIVILVVASFRSAVADWNDVPTGSMKPTILEGDRIVISKVAYDLRIPFTRIALLRWGNPLPGDIVVLESPHDKKRLVKRVMAVAGQRIRILGNRVSIDGSPLRYRLLDPAPRGASEGADIREFIFLEEHVGDRDHSLQLSRGGSQRPNYREIVIPEGYYFVMGDNRDHSFDSRAFGLVHRDRIFGKAVAVALSVTVRLFPKTVTVPLFSLF